MQKLVKLICPSNAIVESSKEKEDLSCVGQDMLRAALGQEPKPIIVKVVAMDAAKMKGIKKLINDIVKYEPNERITMADVVDRLRKIADGLCIIPLFTANPFCYFQFSKSLY